MFTERTALRERLIEIREERRLLGDEHWTVIKRLRELDNMERESIDSEHVMNSLIQVIGDMRNVLPNIPIETYFKYLNQASATAYKDLIEPAPIVEEVTIVKREGV
jgi:hypothetical protein